MAYPDHYLCQYGGPSTDPEIWSNNIRFIAEAPLTTEDQQEAAAAMKTAILAWGAVAASGWSSGSKLSYVKFNRIDADGEYFDKANTQRVDFAPVAMGSLSPGHVFQVALCISWVTDFMRGPASKGRIFLPRPSLAVDPATGRLTATTCLNAANAAAAFLNAANTALSNLGLLDPQVEASVVSNLAETKARIVAVRVGNVLDTQRRRRNALPEVYTTGTTLVVDA